MTPPRTCNGHVEVAARRTPILRPRRAQILVELLTNADASASDGRARRRLASLGWNRMRVWLALLPAACRGFAQGQINAAIVEPTAPEQLVDLSRIEDLELRYFAVVEPGSRETATDIILAGRGGRGAGNPSDETWNMQLLEMDGTTTTVIWDRGFTSNGFIRKFGSRYYAFGGEYIDDSEDEWQQNDPRDGVHVIVCDQLGERDDPRGTDTVFGGAMYSPVHGYHGEYVSTHQFAFDGWHGGRIDARGGTNDIMMFDGKLSVVQRDGHWLVYARANLQYHGGRFVVVAKSRTEMPWGDEGTKTGYEDFQLIDIIGYDRNGPGNVYFAGIDRHPFDEDMLVGLFPINYGEPGRHDGDGESFIGLSMSCDGVHWSNFTQLVWSVGREGRTYDHPVDGMILEADGRVAFLVHRNVMGISPHAPQDSRLLKYHLQTAAFNELTNSARQTLPSCLVSLQPRAPPTLSPQPLSPPPSTSPSTPPPSQSPPFTPPPSASPAPPRPSPSPLPLAPQPQPLASSLPPPSSPSMSSSSPSPAPPFPIGTAPAAEAIASNATSRRTTNPLESTNTAKPALLAVGTLLMCIAGVLLMRPRWGVQFMRRLSGGVEVSGGSNMQTRRSEKGKGKPSRLGSCEDDDDTEGHVGAGSASRCKLRTLCEPTKGREIHSAVEMAEADGDLENGSSASQRAFRGSHGDPACGIAATCHVSEMAELNDAAKQAAEEEALEAVHAANLRVPRAAHISDDLD